MEAVGFAASLLTLVSAALESTKVIYELASNLVDSPKALENLATAIKHLESILRYFERLGTSGSIRREELQQIDDAFWADLSDLLADCNKDLSNIRHHLDKINASSSPHIAKKTRRAIRMKLQERDLEEIWKKLLHYTELFTWQLNRTGINELKLLHTENTKLVQDTTNQVSSQLSQRVDDFRTTWENRGSKVETILGSIHSSLRLQEKATAHFATAQSKDNAQILQKIAELDGQLSHRQDPMGPIHDVEDKMAAISDAIRDLGIKFEAMNGAKFQSGGQSTPSTSASKSNETHPFRSSFERLLTLAHNWQNNIPSSVSMSSIADLRVIIDYVETLSKQGLCEPSNLCRECCVGEVCHTRTLFHLTQSLKLVTPEDSLASRPLLGPEAAPFGGGHHRMTHINNMYSEKPPSHLERGDTNKLSVSMSERHDINPSRSSVAAPEDPFTVRNRKTRRSFNPVLGQPSAYGSSVVRAVEGHPPLKRTRTHLISSETDLGRIDILTKRQCLRVPREVDGGEEGSDEFFSASVMLTPASRQHLGGRVTFRCQQRLNGGISPTLLSFCAIRPSDSLVFEIAMHGSTEELTQTLADGDASLSDCDEDGRGLLGYALMVNNYQIVEFLIAHGADVDRFERGFLLFDPCPVSVIFQGNNWNHCESPDELRQRNTECLRIMLQSGADPTHLDFESTSMVKHVLETYSATSVKVLLDHGYPFVTPNQIMDDMRHPLSILTRAHALNFSPPYQIPAKIALFLSRGADCNCRDTCGTTCLQEALNYKRADRAGFFRVYENVVSSEHDGELKDILMLLITAGADVYTVNDDGESASDYARWGDHWREWSEALIECGFDIEDVAGREHPPGEAWSSAIDPKAVGPKPPFLSFGEYLEIRKSRLRVQDLSDDEWETTESSVMAGEEDEYDDWDMSEESENDDDIEEKEGEGDEDHAAASDEEHDESEVEDRVYNTTLLSTQLGEEDAKRKLD